MRQAEGTGHRQDGVLVQEGAHVKGVWLGVLLGVAPVKSRWLKVIGPISAVVASLLELGWLLAVYIERVAPRRTECCDLGGRRESAARCVLVALARDSVT